MDIPQDHAEQGSPNGSKVHKIRTATSTQGSERVRDTIADIEKPEEGPVQPEKEVDRDVERGDDNNVTAESWVRHAKSGSMNTDRGLGYMG
jgi:hypothetical protein